MFRFAAHDLRPNVTVSYDKRFAAIADTAALDIREALKEFIPPGLPSMLRDETRTHVLTASQLPSQKPSTSRRPSKTTRS